MILLGESIDPKFYMVALGFSEINKNISQKFCGNEMEVTNNLYFKFSNSLKFLRTQGDPLTLLPATPLLALTMAKFCGTFSFPKITKKIIKITYVRSKY